MKEVAHQTFRLGSRGHNFYLIQDHDEVTVVDAGCSKDWKQLTNALDDLGLGLDSVAGIVITHVHSDHLGFGRQAEIAGLTVSVHEDDEPRALGTYRGRFSASVKDLPLYSIRTVRNMWPMLRAGVMSFEHLEVVTTFKDGDQLDLPGRPTVIHTPGHTEGHAMFLSDSESLFTGDGLVTMDLLGSSKGPQRINNVFNVDTEQYMVSLAKLREVEANQILPGHGDPWRGTPGEAADIALKLT